MVAEWNAKERKLVPLLIVLSSSLILMQNFVDCDISTTTTPGILSDSKGAGTGAPAENYSRTIEVATPIISQTRTEYLEEQLSKDKMDVKETNTEYSLTTFKSYSNWDKENKTCIPSTERPHWDICLRATVEMVNGTILSFLGFILNCNQNGMDKTTGTCGCLPDTFPVTDFTVKENRTACLMRNVKAGEECISPWECEDQHHCIYNETAKSSYCRNSSWSFSPEFILICLVLMLSADMQYRY